MPERMRVSKELADLLGVLGHPHRLRIVEELREEERDVNSLRELLGISHSSVSQHLATLRAHRLVVERREGRHVFYHLRQPGLAVWLVQGLQYIGGDPRDYEELQSAVERVRDLWSGTPAA